jgi:ABC-type Zn uptake system ZnuABC Zn-binding protein ZnuA
VDLLLPPDRGCPHDYALTPGDMKKISRADIMITNGLGMEEFLSSPEWKKRVPVRIVEAASGAEPLRFLPENHGKEDHDHDRLNPHLFASPRRAIVYVRNIAQSLRAVDPEGVGVYKKNADSFVLKLEKLAEEIRKVAKEAKNKKIISMHDSLSYLLRDAGLEILYAPEHEKEFSARDMVDVIKIIKKHRPAAIFSDPQYSDKTAKTLSRETGVPHFFLDPGAAGVRYETGWYEVVMQKNIAIMKRALKE